MPVQKVCYLKAASSPQMRHVKFGIRRKVQSESCMQQLELVQTFCNLSVPIDMVDRWSTCLNQQP